MEKFTSKKALVANYVQDDRDVFFLQQFGYHDFHYIAPAKTLHVQKMYTLHFVVSGTGTLNIYGKQYHLKQYDMFLIPPAVHFSYYPNEENPWAYIWFEFTGRNASVYAEKMGVGIGNPMVTCYNTHRAYRTINEVFGRLDREEEIGYYGAFSFFYQIIDTCIPKISHHGEDLISKAVSYIRCHYHDPDLRVEAVCRNLNVTYAQICNNFRQSRGMNIKEFIIQTRIHEAKTLLLESDLSVNEVAFSVGYADNIHFMKSFKKYTGMTANEYRKTKAR